MRRLLSIFIVLWLAQAVAFAAGATLKCKGTVIDEESEPIIGASIVITGGKAVGTTDIDGNFAVTIPDGTRSLTFSYIGYEPKTVNARADMGTIKMVPSNEMLNDVVVKQELARTRQTPVAVSQVNKAEIEAKLGTQELPEILNTTPGVWATKDGGGFGDAKINMRGFQSANVAVLVNGIPVNDMEGGWVYWSNWAGLNEVASNIQTQRGLGAAVLSAPSIGGTVNITTQSLDAEKGGSVWYGMGNDGMNEMGMKVSTGMMKHGWAVTVLGSHKYGDGYIQGTNFNAYNYFINISKRINDRHSLSLTAFGAPQTHNKRGNKDGLSIIQYQEYAKNVMGSESPYRYNATFGYDLNGQVRSSNRNTYHKPQISLAHVWKIDRKSSLSTTVYASLAKGGGYSGQGRGTYNGTALSNSSWYGATNGKANTLFRNADGTFAYDKIQLMNEASTTGSNMVMSESNNSHNWFGLVSTYNNRFFDDKLNILAGIDLRYYVGFHNNKIIDLYNGEYFMDDSSRKNVKPANNAAAADPNWKYEKLGVGDIVYRNYEGRTQQEGAYVQGELNLFQKRLNLVLSGSLNNTGYQRVDKFYYDKEHGKTPVYNFIGGTVKFGANYNIDRHNNVFANVGYISRAPFFAYGVFLSQAVSNATNPDPVNEKVFSAELGYNFRSRMFSATVNAYYTKWMDKTTVRGGTIEVGEHIGDRYALNLTGVNARHMGIEINATFVPTTWLEITGMLSLGDYIWDNNAKGYFYNQNGEPIKNSAGDIASGIMAEDHAWGILNQKGVRVGGSAQTTGALGLVVKPFQGFRIGADWKASARNYSDYTISTPNFNQTINLAKPWRIPWGNQLDLHASYRFNIGGVSATLYGNVHNIFNYNYVVDAWSNSQEDATWENIYGVFYSFGRTYSLKLRVNF
ncbi:MAG: carboxypeptidase-like regulatory domain-containing protein [Muribaculaceae bacterium]|nr:carboxypeptidase-like regulatory domain-containing protein [Muribaculaceae bacterium]